MKNISSLEGNKRLFKLPIRLDVTGERHQVPPKTVWRFRINGPESSFPSGCDNVRGMTHQLERDKGNDRESLGFYW
jgi:hypothetical protein